jgi:hypothetical protein
MILNVNNRRLESKNCVNITQFQTARLLFGTKTTRLWGGKNVSGG